MLLTLCQIEIVITILFHFGDFFSVKILNILSNYIVLDFLLSTNISLNCSTVQMGVGIGHLSGAQHTTRLFEVGTRRRLGTGNQPK
jgi:hypothetical protein